MFGVKLEFDYDSTPPDKHSDGFWPSLNPASAGYIGPKSLSTWRRHMAYAKRVMKAWEEGEWGYITVFVAMFEPRDLPADDDDDDDDDEEDTDDPQFPDDYEEIDYQTMGGVEYDYPPMNPRHWPDNSFIDDVIQELISELTHRLEKQANAA